MLGPAMKGQLSSALVVVLFFAAVGIGGSAGGATGPPIRIGAIFSETGGLASIGAPGLAGMRLAAAQVNARGGILGRRVEIVAEDSRSTRTAVANAVRRLIRDRRVVALGGLNDSTLVLAAGPVAQRAGVPFVTAGATLPSLPRRVGNTLFMAAYGDDAQAFAMADLARARFRARSSYVLLDRDADFTVALARFFRQRFVARGGTIVGSASYETGERDFAATMTRIRNLEPQPDVLFFSGLPSEAGPLVRQARRIGLAQPILSGDGFDTPLIGEVAGNLADDVYFATHVSLDSRAPRVRRFVTSYRQRYGRLPENAFAALGYDTLNLLANAVRRAGTDKPGAIRDALARTRNFAMVTGTISFGPGRLPPRKPVTILRVTNGGAGFYATVLPR